MSAPPASAPVDAPAGSGLLTPDRGVGGAAGLALAHQRVGSERRCLVLLLSFVLALYAFTMPGKIVSGDGEAMYQTTKALITQRRLSIEPRPETAPGRGG